MNKNGIRKDAVFCFLRAIDRESQRGGRGNVASATPPRAAEISRAKSYPLFGLEGSSLRSAYKSLDLSPTFQ